MFIGKSNCKSQTLLLPNSIDDMVPEDYPVRTLDEIVEQMDHSELLRKYKGGGAPAYHPVMMLKILIYAYSIGVRSSRKINELTTYDTRFMYLAGMEKPDFRTICRFRRNNADTVNRVFEETVKIGYTMGLVLLDHVSVDGTKIEANVSGKETYSMKRADESLEKIKNRIATILEEAERADREEDARYGDRMGNEVPEDLKKASARKKRLEEIKKKMEETGRQTLCATDPDSRVMKTKSGNRAAYNAQAAVDGKNQFIVAADVTQSENDCGELVPMIERVEKNTGAMPKTVTADSGYHSQENLQYASDKGLNAYVPEKNNRIEFRYDADKDEYVCPAGKALKYRCNNRNRHGKLYRVYRCADCAGCEFAKSCQGIGRGKKPRNHRDLSILEGTDMTLREEMQMKVKSKKGKLIYALRKIIVEPVFGDIKFNMNLAKFLLRGLEGVRIEFLLGCIAHNLKKMMAFWMGWKKKLAIV
ncbi:MAG: IS1182 family transposase [Candidatus Aureabacteria bacterium]|nr:IS1182 family transposase [Candidatus Auribacterota bacterium]